METSTVEVDSLSAYSNLSVYRTTDSNPILFKEKTDDWNPHYRPLIIGAHRT